MPYDTHNAYCRAMRNKPERQYDHQNLRPTRCPAFSGHCTPGSLGCSNTLSGRIKCVLDHVGVVVLAARFHPKGGMRGGSAETARRLPSHLRPQPMLGILEVVGASCHGGGFWPAPLRPATETTGLGEPDEARFAPLLFPEPSNDPCLLPEVATVLEVSRFRATF
jgi:hypothetical protein